MKKENLIYSTLILTIASIITRIIGMVFRVYLSNQIGAVGMGLYQMIISVYSRTDMIMDENGHAGPVAHELVGTGEGIEQCRFAAVGVARKGNSDIHDTLLLLVLANLLSNKFP